MGAETQGPYPAVIFDDVAVGEMAFAHLHSLGLKSLAFCGMPGRRFSDERLAGMRKAAERHGRHVIVFPEHVAAALARYAVYERQLVSWLQALPKPVGLLAATTAAARDVVTFLRFASIRVPEDVALLGVDPDELTSELTTPRLSYIDQGARRLGHQAAALLDRLMHGGTPPASPLRVPPAAVIARQSTDVLALDDPDLVRALRFVREHALEPITVKQILRATPMARRTLERGFTRILGRTVHEEITRLRIERAKQLLVETNMPMARIAASCGFERASSLSALFTRTCGMSARDYRRSASPRRN
jgi:LacI family transcriptional regulator